MSNAEAGAPRWTMVLSVLLCVAGVGVAAYLTYAHYTTAKVLACSDKGLVNCAKVTTSSYSRIAGIPVADAGLAFFVVMVALCSPWAWRSSWLVLRYARLISASAGVVLVLWLLYAELFRLNAICLYCTAVHVITLLLFITVAFGTAATSPLVAEDDAGADVTQETLTGHPG